MMTRDDAQRRWRRSVLPPRLATPSSGCVHRDRTEHVPEKSALRHQFNVYRPRVTRPDIKDHDRIARIRLPAGTGRGPSFTGGCAPTPHQDGGAAGRSRAGTPGSPRTDKRSQSRP